MHCTVSQLLFSVHPIGCLQFLGSVTCNNNLALLALHFSQALPSRMHIRGLFVVLLLYGYGLPNASALAKGADVVFKGSDVVELNSKRNHALNYKYSSHVPFLPPPPPPSTLQPSTGWLRTAVSLTLPSYGGDGWRFNGTDIVQ